MPTGDASPVDSRSPEKPYALPLVLLPLRCPGRPVIFGPVYRGMAGPVIRLRDQTPDKANDNGQEQPRRCS